MGASNRTGRPASALWLFRPRRSGRAQPGQRALRSLPPRAGLEPHAEEQHRPAAKGATASLVSTGIDHRPLQPGDADRLHAVRGGTNQPPRHGTPGWASNGADRAGHRGPRAREGRRFRRVRHALRGGGRGRTGFGRWARLRHNGRRGFGWGSRARLRSRRERRHRARDCGRASREQRVTEKAHARSSVVECSSCHGKRHLRGAQGCAIGPSGRALVPRPHARSPAAGATRCSRP